MELVFVDETGDEKFKDYFGLSVATINAAHYKKLKQGFHKILIDSGWDCTIEFKGAFLFSAKKGDPNVDINTRVDICTKIVDLNISDKNARMFAYYASKRGVQDQKTEYLRILPLLLKKALPKAKAGKGKDVIAISCDYRSDISKPEIQTSIADIVSRKGYCLYETVLIHNSNFETVGILYADIIGYLAARIETIRNDIELFENIPPEEIENNGKLKKLKSSTNLITRIKNLNWYNITEK